MTQQAVAFNDTGTGREQITDGLMRHRGTLWVGPGTPTEGLWRTQSPPPIPLVVYGQQVEYAQPGPLDDGAWSKANLELISNTPSWVGIAFAEQGLAALCLYRPQGAATQLRLRGNDGTDYALAGGPGSAQALVGSYVQLVSWTIPNASGWYETPIQVIATFTGVRVRLEYSLSFSAPTLGQRHYWSLMLDGGLINANYAMGLLDQPAANGMLSASGIYYHTPSPGSHRYGVALYSSGINLQISNQGLSCLFATEQRC